MRYWVLEAGDYEGCTPDLSGPFDTLYAAVRDNYNMDEQSDAEIDEFLKSDIFTKFPGGYMHAEAGGPTVFILEIQP